MQPEPISSIVKAGRHVCVGRLACYLNYGRYAKRSRTDDPICLAAKLEYLAAEVLDLARNATQNSKINRMISWHIQLAILNNEDMGKLQLSGKTMAYRVVRRPRSLAKHFRLASNSSFSLLVHRLVSCKILSFLVRLHLWP